MFCFQGNHNHENRSNQKKTEVEIVKKNKKPHENNKN